MASLRTHLLRRAVMTGLLSLLALAFLPGAADAAQPATMRLLGTDPAYRSMTLTMPNGARVSGSPGLFRLRITPAGGTAVERRGFCVDGTHPIGANIDYAVSLRTVADDARLATPRYGEAAWLIQSAEGLIAAAAPDKRALESGALQVAVWQLTDQAREVNPTDDAALNARTAALRTLASGRAIGGPVTITPAMARGCAGRSSVALNLTGTPGSSATLAVTGGPGTVSPAEVRFGADGTAQAAVTSASPGTVTVTARAEGGALTRIGRTGTSTMQETMVLVPQSYSAVASVVFDDCPVIPFEGNPTPATPVTPVVPVDPFESPSTKPLVPTTTPSVPAPRTPSQAAPKYSVVKTGPESVSAGKTARYTITVVNRGTALLRNLTLTDDLPQGMSLTSTPSGARLAGGDVVWSLSPLKAGGRRVIRVTVRVDADISGHRCNRATVTSPGGPTHTSSACTMVKPVSRAILPAVTA